SRAAEAASGRSGELRRERVDVFLHRVERRLYIGRQIRTLADRVGELGQLPVQRRERRLRLDESLLQIVHLGGEIEHPPAVGRGQGDLRVVGHAQRFGVRRLAVDNERDCVNAGEHPRSGRVVAAAEESAAATLPRRFAPRAERTLLLLCFTRACSLTFSLTRGLTSNLTLSLTASLTLGLPSAPAASRSRRRGRRLHAQIP